MQTFIKKLSLNYNLAIVGGSDISKAKEQLGDCNLIANK